MAETFTESELDRLEQLGVGGGVTAEEFQRLINVARAAVIHTYRLHWRGGKTEDVCGTSIADAMTQAGYGGGAVAALDYHEELPSSQ